MDPDPFMYDIGGLERDSPGEAYIWSATGKTTEVSAHKYRARHSRRQMVEDSDEREAFWSRDKDRRLTRSDSS